MLGCVSVAALGCAGTVDGEKEPGAEPTVEGEARADAGHLPDPGIVQPPGGDSQTPYPIDTGDQGEATPGTYKGLWQRLTDNGEPEVTAVDGVIGVVCVGMSNGRQECDDFIDRRLGIFSEEISASVKVVNCAVGSHAIERWNDPVYDGTLWDACLTTKLSEAGLRPDQVRVLWHKAANQFTTSGGKLAPPYPDEGSDFFTFRRNLAVFAARVPVKFPSVQAVYVSSRSYGGFADSPGRGEPLSFEEGHALNDWLGENPVVEGVWYGWGPYLWAPDCASGARNGSGVCYERADFVTDGVHPSASGEAKISGMLHSRWLQHSWYRR